MIAMTGVYYKSTEAGQLYRGLISDLCRAGQVVDPVESGSSPSAGKQTFEFRGTTLILEDPRASLVVTGARPLNYGFAFGNFLNLLAGLDELPAILYYNPIAVKFSDDGQRLHGAYGPRINNQLQYVIALLRADPMTRRAAVTIFDPRDHRESKDIPCPLSMQFLVREKKLIMLTFFRSQNIVMLYPYDIVLFTLIHQFIAAQLGLGLGEHIQYCGSAHIYAGERGLVREICDTPLETTRLPEMASLSGTEISQVLHAERGLRSYGLGTSQWPGLIHPKLPNYWKWYLAVLLAFAEAKRRGETTMRDHRMVLDLMDLWL